MTLGRSTRDDRQTHPDQNQHDPGDEERAHPIAERGRRRRDTEDRLQKLHARRDRKSTRLNSVTNAHLVCRLLLEKKKEKQKENCTQTSTTRLLSVQFLSAINTS